MGYFQNTYENWQEFVDRMKLFRVCARCGGEFIPYSPNQKKHSYQHFLDEDESCVLEGELEEMSPSQYLRHVGMTKEHFIKEYGEMNYCLIVLQINSAPNR